MAAFRFKSLNLIIPTAMLLLVAVSCGDKGTANGLSLASYSSLMQGGNSGAVVIPGDPDNSIIIRRLEGDIQPQMPYQRPPLPQAQIQLIRDWIAEGAHNN